MKDKEEMFGFDPTSIVKIILENKELGLALVQIPITLINNFMGANDQLEWKSHPSTMGYYWGKNEKGLVTILTITEESLQAIHEDRVPGYQYAGPLVPPK